MSKRAAREVELQKVPQQTISSMCFGNVMNENILAVGSWACSLDVYKCGTGMFGK